MRKLKKKVVSGNFTHFACVESFVYNKLWHSIKSTSYTRVEELKPRKRYRRCNKFLHCRARELSKKKNFFIALMMNEKKERKRHDDDEKFQFWNRKIFRSGRTLRKRKIRSSQWDGRLFSFSKNFQQHFYQFIKNFSPDSLPHPSQQSRADPTNAWRLMRRKTATNLRSFIVIEARFLLNKHIFLYDEKKRKRQVE